MIIALNSHRLREGYLILSFCRVSSLPDFVKLAEAYGHKGIRIENPADVVPALEKAFFGEFKNDLVFLDFVIKKEANVYPMIPAGKGLTDMVLGDK